MISRYNKIVPLEIPKDTSTELFVKGLEQVNKRLETNASELSAYSDQLSQIDLIRPIDKEYFDSKYNSLVGEINNLAKTDLANPMFAKNAKQKLSSLLKDPTILKAKQSTENIRNVQKQWQTVLGDARLLKNYKDSNYSMDLADINEYLNSGIEGSFNKKNASLYSGIYENIDSQGAKLKASQTTAPISDFTLAVREAKSVNGLASLTVGNTELDHQLQIDYKYAKSQDKDLDNRLKKSVEDSIAFYKAGIEKLEPQIGMTNEGSSFKSLYNQELNYYKQKLAQLEEIKKTPENGFLLFKNLYSQNFVNKHQEEKISYKQNPEANALAYNLKVKQMEHDFQQDNIIASLKEKELNIEAQKNSLKEGLGIGGDDPLIFQNNTAEIPDSEYVTAYKNTIENIHSENKQLLGSILERINTLPGIRENIAELDKQLAKSGIKIDWKNYQNVDKMLLVPANINKLNSAVDYVLTHSGKVNENPTTIRLVQDMEKLASNSRLTVARGFQIKEAERATLAAGFSPSKSKSEYEKEFAKNLKLMGNPIYQDKIIPLTGALNDNTKEGKKLSSYLQTMLLNKGWVTDDKENVAYAYQSNIQSTNKKVNSDLNGQVDISKSEIIAIEPSKKRLKVNFKDKEGRELGQFYIKLDESELESLVNYVAPGTYSNLINSTETFDDFYDNLQDKNVKHMLSSQNIYLAGASIGLPTGFHLSYNIVGGRKNERAISFMYNNKKYQINEFASEKDFKTKLKYSYDLSLQAVLKNDPSLSRAQAEKKAIQITMSKLAEKSS